MHRNKGTGRSNVTTRRGHGRVDLVVARPLPVAPPRRGMIRKEELAGQFVVEGEKEGKHNSLRNMEELGTRWD